MIDEPMMLHVVFIYAWQMEGFLEKPFAVGEMVSWMLRPQDSVDHELGAASGDDRARTITYYYEVDDLSGPVTDLPETRGRIVGVEEIACRYEPVGDSVLHSPVAGSDRAVERQNVPDPRRYEYVELDLVGYLVRLETLT
jgi:hypothetical protein